MQRMLNSPWFLAGAAFLVLAATAAVLAAMDQVLICRCGYVKIWHGIVASSENSQHLADWYTFSHIIHGVAFYGIGHLVRRTLARRGIAVPLGAIFIGALGIEAGWEVFENTDYVINRYREVTISREYYGDSVINSIADVAAMIAGFALAARLPIWTTLALVAALEVGVGWAIRDNLTLNILMLLYPLPFILEWQRGGG
ncbi:DUF2585 family protein [Candidatus Parcubacteria bacterium]|nr:MAG: DUF2585 family protein [Candidatus Parcubacteria bacterium]